MMNSCIFVMNSFQWCHEKCTKWKSNGNFLKRFGLTKNFSAGENKSTKVPRLHVATGLTVFT